MNLAMLLEMAADGLGTRVGIGARDDGLTFARLRELAGGRLCTREAHQRSAHLERGGIADHVIMVREIVDVGLDRYVAAIGREKTDADIRRPLDDRADDIWAGSDIDRIGHARKVAMELGQHARQEVACDAVLA